MEALYFRVSIDHQATENQFDELITAARVVDPTRDWNRIQAVDMFPRADHTGK
jgi:hypothetical protein